VASELHDERSMAGIQHNLGLLSLQQGDSAKSRASLESAMSIYEGLEDREGVARTQLTAADLATYEDKPEQADKLLRECLPVIQALKDELSISAAEHTLAKVAMLKGDGDKAKTQLLQCLQKRLRLSDRLGVVRVLATIAQLAIPRHALPSAAKLYALVDARLRALGTRLSVPEQLDFDRAIGTIRSQIGDPAFDQAWAKGQVMTDSDAVSVAAGV
jgi:hypothetical protein